MNFDKLRDLIATLPSRGFPACDLSLAKDGKEILRLCAGYSDAAATKPVSKDDMYWVFSISKIATCIGAMRLVEEGKIALSDPVANTSPPTIPLRCRKRTEASAPQKRP